MRKRSRAGKIEILGAGFVRCPEMDEVGSLGTVSEIYKAPEREEYRRIGPRGFVEHKHSFGAVAAMYWHPLNLVHRDKNGGFVCWYLPDGR